MHPARVSCVVALACLVLIGATPSPAAGAGNPARPNVLMISVDDMSDWIGALGGYRGKVHTPNIDALAARGLLFTNAHCASPLCSPSRTAIYTGLRPTTTGIYDNSQWWRPVLPDVVTLPMHFKANGYRTEGSGKIYHHSAGFNPPDQWHLFRRQTWNELWETPIYNDAEQLPPEQRTPSPAEFPISGLATAGKAGFAPSFDWGPLPKEDHELGDGQIVAWARERLRRPADEPFFLAVGLLRPHLPFYAPKKYFDLYPPEEIVPPAVRADDLDDLPPAGRKFSAATTRDLELIENGGQYTAVLRAYLACISFVDALVGELIAELDRSPHARNTIVIFWSDHGWQMGEKRRWQKMTLWERATRVPLIIVAPGVTRPGTRTHRPVSLIDLYPTLVELCGLPPRKLDGQSLVPLLRNPDAQWSRPALVTYLFGNHAVRSEHWRYIRYADGGEELYDHRTDPHEWTNLAERPEFADIKRDLARWIPERQAQPAPNRRSFVFDPATYTWSPAPPAPPPAKRKAAPKKS